MRNVLLLGFLFFGSGVYSQLPEPATPKLTSPEQIALDFFAENVVENSVNGGWGYNYKRVKVFYDGKVQVVDSNYDEASVYWLTKFYSCKLNPRGFTNDSVKTNLSDYSKILTKINKFSFKLSETLHLITIPKKYTSEKT